MRGMLVNDKEAVAGLRDDIRLVNLRTCRPERAIEQIGRSCQFRPDVRRRGADIECGLAWLGERGGCGSLKSCCRPRGKSGRGPPGPIRLSPVRLSWCKSRAECVDRSGPAVGGGAFAFAGE